MRLSLVLIALACLARAAFGEDTVVITVPTGNELVQSITGPEPETVTAATSINAHSLNADVMGLRIHYPPATYQAEVDDRVPFTIIAGSDFSFPMQMRIGEMPLPFDALYPPVAVLKNGAAILATYTIVIDDVPNAIWSQKLSAAQTAALAGKSGITEISLPDDNGVYGVWYRLKTVIISPVTQ